MVEFETMTADRVEFGSNNFIEVARKKAITEDDVHEFLSISRGYTLADGTERWKTSLTVPDEDEVINFIAEHIQKV